MTAVITFELPATKRVLDTGSVEDAELEVSAQSPLILVDGGDEAIVLRRAPGSGQWGSMHANTTPSRCASPSRAEDHRTDKTRERMCETNVFTTTHTSHLKVQSYSAHHSPHGTDHQSHEGCCSEAPRLDDRLVIHCAQQASGDGVDFAEAGLSV